jgi:hypothetical protein
MPKRKYSREFKESAVKLVYEQGYTPVEAAKSPPLPTIPETSRTPSCKLWIFGRVEVLLNFRHPCQTEACRGWQRPMNPMKAN